MREKGQQSAKILTHLVTYLSVIFSFFFFEPFPNDIDDDDDDIDDDDDYNDEDDDHSGLVQTRVTSGWHRPKVTSSISSFTIRPVMMIIMMFTKMFMRMIIMIIRMV